MATAAITLRIRYLPGIQAATDTELSAFILDLNGQIADLQAIKELALKECGARVAVQIAKAFTPPPTQVADPLQPVFAKPGAGHTWSHRVRKKCKAGA